MANNYIKIAEWFEALGESQGITTIQPVRQMDWDTIIKQSQTLRVITRGETMSAMRVQQQKLERLTKASLSKLVEESVCRN